MKKIFAHNVFFRLFAPPVYGSMVYIMVLLVFDSIGQLRENFFSQEVLLCMGCTLLLFESLRLVILVCDRLFPVAGGLARRLAAQVTITSLCSVILITTLISLYFTRIVGYSSFRTELITFNVIFLVSTLLYNMIHFSLIYLHSLNEEKLDRETVYRKNLELQLQAFNNQINPQLLYSSLETLISLGYKDSREAERYIEKLSAVYRYVLDNQHQELAGVEEEVAVSRELLFLLNQRFNGNIRFRAGDNLGEASGKLVPRTLPVLLEGLVNNSIINDIQPFELNCYIEPEDNFLVLQCRMNPKLTTDERAAQDMEELQRAYRFFTEKPIVQIKAYGEQFIKVPLLNVAAN